MALNENNSLMYFMKRYIICPHCDEELLQDSEDIHTDGDCIIKCPHCLDEIRVTRFSIPRFSTGGAYNIKAELIEENE